MTLSETEIRVAIADDHTLFREGLVRLLSASPGLTVVADGCDGNEAISLAEKHQPDIMLLDVEMPGPGVRNVVRSVRNCSPATGCVVLTMYDDAELLKELLEMGVVGYLVKAVASRELIAAIHSAARRPGQMQLSVSRFTLDRCVGNAPAAKTLLSSRELEVLALVARACSNAQVATKLFITESTVKRHLTNIYTKLGAVSRVDAIRRGIAAGLIQEIGAGSPPSRLDSSQGRQFGGHSRS